jgi:hypothetical protein
MTSLFFNLALQLEWKVSAPRLTDWMLGFPPGRVAGMMMGTVRGFLFRSP